MVRRTKFLSVRELRNRPGRVWDEAQHEDLVVTSNGKPVGVLIGVAEGELDDVLLTLRRARAAAAVSRLRQQASAGTPKLSERDINAEITATRREARDR